MVMQMSEDEVLDALAERFGIVSNFGDLSGVCHPTSRETKLALLQANGVDTHSASALADELHKRKCQNSDRICVDEVIIVAETQNTISITQPTEWSLILDEDCSSDKTFEGRDVSGIDLPKLPSGVHKLLLHGKQDGQTVTVIASPKQAPSVVEQTGQSKIWGINAALYGLHSNTTRGIGTYRDLGLTAEVMSKHGASFLGINPVHSIGWADDQTISPYSPSHRGFLNTSHIDISDFDELPDAPKTSSSILDYRTHRLAHHAALEKAFTHFNNHASAIDRSDFYAYCTGEGMALQKFALFEALSEINGADWRDWPEQFQDAESDAVFRFAKLNKERVDFHAWLQWMSDKQLGEAQSRARASGMVSGLYLDLAVGSRRGAAETWCEKSSVAQGVSIGAPPDHLSPAGQNWNLAAFTPSRLKETQYGPFRNILARSLRHAGILRIDHVLGLNRSYWIPDSGEPGGYVRQPFEALLAIIAIEANKAGSVIVGEDLGLVPEGLRDGLHKRGLYSYSVLQYEKDKNGDFRNPQDLPQNSLTCFSTHDTPTLHGYMQQRDIDWWRKLDWIDSAKEKELRNLRVKETRALRMLNPQYKSTDLLADFDQLNHTVHSVLANSPAAMVSVQLDDALGEIEAQNLPGTIDEHLNWQRRTSLPIQQFSDYPALCDIATQMRFSKRSAPHKDKT